MNKKIKLLLTACVLVLFITQCQQKNDADTTPGASVVQPIPGTVAITKQIVLTSKFDSIIQQLKNKNDLTKNDILSLKVIDTVYINNSNEHIYCDTTVQLNDSIFYSIISLPDTEGICSHHFILTIDEKNKKPIAAKYFMPDCDIDFSQNIYSIYEYKILTKDKIKLIQNTVYQKKNRTSANEEKNIDHKQIDNFYFNISSAGQVVESKK